jgi:hypothetical protein
LKRLGNVESQVSAILATIPHLATKTDVADLRADVAALETAIIKRVVATMLASAALAFTIAKFVH